MRIYLILWKTFNGPHLCGALLLQAEERCAEAQCTVSRRVRPILVLVRRGCLRCEGRAFLLLI